MSRFVFAAAIAALAFVTVSGISQAAPVAPLPAGVVSDAGAGNITKVYWHHRHWRHWCRWHRC
ncbi:MAG: hypothetical protein P4L80_13115 [Xanthobacteraceae bacterium]|nr:hypothetical protein [Xanthobacteraceae bacterium]